MSVQEFVEKYETRVSKIFDELGDFTDELLDFMASLDPETQVELGSKLSDLNLKFEAEYYKRIKEKQIAVGL